MSKLLQSEGFDGFSQESLKVLTCLGCRSGPLVFAEVLGADPEEELVEFAMKMMHKPTLKRERAIRYDKDGTMQMINNLDKVYTEIELWT